MFEKINVYHIGNARSGTYLCSTDQGEGKLNFGVGTYPLVNKLREAYAEDFDWFLLPTDLSNYYLIINKKNGRALLPELDKKKDARKVYLETISSKDGCIDKAFYWKVQAVAKATSGTPLIVTRLDKNDIKDGVQGDPPTEGGEYLYIFSNYHNKHVILAPEWGEEWLAGKPALFHFPMKDVEDKSTEAAFFWLLQPIYSIDKPMRIPAVVNSESHLESIELNDLFPTIRSMQEA